MIGFERRRSFEDPFMNTSIMGLKGEIDAKQSERLNRIRQAWNFYEGFHWEDMPSQDTPELTVNYCRAFIDKFVSFELGKAFSFTTSKAMEGIAITRDGRTIFEYLEDVWEDNDQYALTIDVGQMKSVTGDAWVQVRFYDPDEMANRDPFNEYPDGRVQLNLLPTSVVFPEFDPHEKGRLLKLTVMYTYEKLIKTPILGKTEKKKVVYKQIWTNEEVAVIDDGTEEKFVNRYGVIPFAHIRNLSVAGRNEGRSDIEDIIPLNTELNTKESDISEIIDYHAAPVTLVYGAKIGNLEKGANKVWGGLAKDAKVENLELKSDLGASTSYVKDLKLAMCEVGGIPETVLGGAQAISNTSGVALEYINLPLVEKTRLKRHNTEAGFEYLNKLILLVSVLEGLIRKPSNVPSRDFFHTEVSIPDTLPKDALLELQQLQQELKMGVESRRNAMKRLGKENIDELIAEIDEDAKNNPEIYGRNPNSANDAELNSGFTNGQTAVEQVRKEMTGENGPQNH